MSRGATRGAADVIAGFRYQITNSVLALIELRADEELLLEISEDYSVSSDENQTDFQVKGSQAQAGPSRFSLQTAAVRDVLLRFWDTEASGNRLVFLARGGAAREKDFNFPGNVPGLNYWAAAGLGADSAPLREALKVIFQGSKLGEWLLSEPNDTELRTRLLNRVAWHLDRLPSDELAIDAMSRLRVLYSAMNLPVVNAEQAMNALLALVFETASKPKPAQRRLTRLDLEATVQSVAGAALVSERMSGAPSHPNDELFLSEVSASSGAALRETTVTECLTAAVGRPLVWIHGAHETGKSYLARLMAQKLGGRWIALDLWPLRSDAAGALAAWRSASARVAADRLDGIIVDDLIADAATVLRSRIGAFAKEVGSRGGRLIITSHQPPSPALVVEPGIMSEPIAAPYFDEADIEELVRLDGGPPAETSVAWSSMIKLTTRGHPLLAAAKIASLRARGWPRSAIMEDMREQSPAIQLTKEGARRELLKDLSEWGKPGSSDASQLLRRVASVFDRADEALVRKLILAEPPLRNGGDAFAVLKGTWLETLPPSDVRVSPLISDIVTDVPPEDLKRWRRLAAEHWISFRTLNERTLPLCFWNAYFGEHDWVLTKISETMQTLTREELRAAAPMLSPITALLTDRPIYSGNPIAAIFVRILQFAVADTLDQGDIASKAAVRLLAELDEQADDVKDLLTVPTAMRALMADTKLPTALHVEYALRLRSAYPNAQKLGLLAPPRTLLPPQLRPDMDTSDFLFTRLVGKASTTSDVLELFQTLDKLDQSIRHRFIDACNLLFGGPSVMVSAGWSGDQLADRDMAAALEGYKRIEEIVRRWPRDDIKIEVAVAQSVILDEGLDRKDEALQTVNRALSTYGAKARLIGQKAKVLGHLERYQEASDLILSIEAKLLDLESFDQALALREGAFLTAKAGYFDVADRIAEKARQAFAMGAGHAALEIAMIIERALIAWRADRKSDALSLAAHALEELVRIDPSSSRQAERTHQFARLIGGLFSSELLDQEFGAGKAFTFGQASHLELSTAELLKPKLGSIADNWRILAVVEAYLGVSTEIDERSMQHQADTLNVSLEWLILRSRYAVAVRIGDVEKALVSGASLIATTRFRGPDGNSLIRAPRDGFVVSPRDALNFDVGNVIPNLLLDLLCAEVERGTLSQVFVSRLKSVSRRVFGEVEGIDLVIRGASQVYAIGNDTSDAAMYANGIAQSQTLVASDPEKRFHRDVLLLVYVSRSLLKDELQVGAASLINDGWKIVVETQGAMLRDSSRTVSAIKGAMRENQGVAAAAAILLAAKNGLRHNLSDGWFGIIEALGNARST
ncbi:hypothetical protein [Mesorhizobium sp.]|uniref:hypothetical protein n=1 Tax=Mesorhizobium sp. TaxID=1871066 RepID=UPI0011F72BA6|nr:hypothetical protein [Mesorhizobium sp.]TIN79755.1 MAG: hypothetical protein E5Y09_04780 [Mesorhizobium sp.]